MHTWMEKNETKGSLAQQVATATEIFEETCVIRD